MTHPFKILCEEVGAWSKRNFGNQESKWLPPHHGIVDGCMGEQPAAFPQALFHIAPLLGIIEEAGELVVASRDKHVANAEDAVGDIIIYLTDYIVRLGDDVPTQFIDWSAIDELLRIECPITTSVQSARVMLIYLGKLVHCNLKRHQGIRDYGSNLKFFPEMRFALEQVIVCAGRLLACAKVVRPAGQTCSVAEIFRITANTWLKVRQRDWKKNAANAAQGELA